jgi:hypothetical protein
MLKALHGRSRLSTAIVVLFVSLVALITVPTSATAMTMSPHKLVLNSVGSSEDVQAIIPMTITAGYTFTAGEATLRFDGIEVATTISLRYCYIDDNLIVSFDKTALLQNPDVIALAGMVVTAEVEGSFTATDADGNTYTQDFSGTDEVEIVAPGKTSELKK